MPIKRVSINISLPSQEFKDDVVRVEGESGKSPSEEFVTLYERRIKHHLPRKP